MEITPLTGPGGIEVPTNSIRVIFPGGTETFKNVVLLQGKEDGSLRLYWVAHQDKDSTRLEIRAAFHRDGWLGFTVEGGTAESTAALGFRPE